LRLVHGYGTAARQTIEGTCNQEYWCDPVLDRYDERPDFHNIKDVAMSKIGAIYSISGTNRTEMVAGTWDRDIAIVAGGGVGNIFTKFAHSMEVNFKNIAKPVTTAVHSVEKAAQNVVHSVAVNAQNIQHGMAVNLQNVKHGMDVNLQNVKHGMDVNFQNTKKGVEIAANQVKEAAIKVSALAMRKAFLSVVALNVRSLATNLDKTRAQSPGNWQKIKDRWHSFGGDQKTLDIAINNGRGRKRIGAAGVDDAGIAAWVTLAATIIAAIMPFLLQHDNGAGNQAALAQDAQAGAAHLLATTYGAATMVTDQNGNQAPAAAATQALSALTEQSQNSGSMAITPGVTSDGAPQLTVHDIATPYDNGSDGSEYNAAGQNLPQGSGQPGSQPGAFDIAFGKFSQFIKDHKGPVIGIVVGGIVVYAIATRPRKRRR
jgi:hypothetical protein